MKLIQTKINNVVKNMGNCIGYCLGYKKDSDPLWTVYHYPKSEPITKTNNRPNNRSENLYPKPGEII